MTQTPRTDAAEKECYATSNGAVISGVVVASFARELELELGEAERRAAEWFSLYNAAAQDSMTVPVSAAAISRPVPADSVAWIPVSERLPKSDADYLVCVKPLLENALFVYSATYTKPKHAFVNPWSYSGVTHWQPLPPPPAQTKEGT